MRRKLWIVAGILVLALVVALLSAPMRLYLRSQPLAVGAPVPALTAPDQHGVVHALGDKRGRPLVVYFYPKDDTPGCTTQACAFRDTWDAFEAAGVQVLGVSGDGAASKKKFSDKYRLPFPVLSDPGNEWAAAFGVRVILGLTARVTFLVDESGRVAKVYPDVDPALNVAEVLADAKALGDRPAQAAAPQATAP